MFLLTSLSCLPGDTGATHFRQTLPRNRALVVLNIRSCGVSSVGLRALIAAVQTNTVLQRGMTERHCSFGNVLRFISSNDRTWRRRARVKRGEHVPRKKYML